VALVQKYKKIVNANKLSTFFAAHGFLRLFVIVTSKRCNNDNQTVAESVWS